MEHDGDTVSPIQVRVRVGSTEVRDGDSVEPLDDQGHVECLEDPIARSAQ
jgi:hypothetical protein